jgi:hypothetical protein
VAREVRHVHGAGDGGARALVQGFYAGHVLLGGLATLRASAAAAQRLHKLTMQQAGSHSIIL